jgi:hypothetical protein
MTEYDDLKKQNDIMVLKNLKRDIEKLTPKELADIGFIRLDTAEEVTRTLSSTFSDLLDGVKEWSEEVVKSSEGLKNAQITAFTTKHLLSLKHMFSLKLSKLGTNEKH